MKGGVGANSKRWFTTSFLQPLEEGVGKRCSELGAGDLIESVYCLMFKRAGHRFITLDNRISSQCFGNWRFNNFHQLKMSKLRVFVLGCC